MIADPLDDQLIAIARGERQDIVDMIYSVMDGAEPAMARLSKELQDYVSNLASTPLDKNKPLWSFHIVENYEKTSHGTKITVTVNIKSKGALRISGIFNKNRFENEFSKIYDQLILIADS